MKIAEGKNLQPLSRISYNSDNGSSYSNGVITWRPKDKNLSRVRILNDIVNFNDGKKYTCSFRYKVTKIDFGNPSDYVVVYYRSLSAGVQTAGYTITKSDLLKSYNDGAWLKASFTLTMNYSAIGTNPIELWIYSTSSNFTPPSEMLISDIKLELGTHATQGGKIALGNKNYILNGECPISGSSASGVVASAVTFQGKNCWKVVSSAGNGSYNSIRFTDITTSASDIGTIPVGSKVSVSMDVYIESGNGVCPTLFLNSGNGYASFTYDNTKIGEWQRVKQVRTWNTPGTNYGNFSPHLGFSSCIGTYYFKNFKLELGAVATPFSISTRNLGNICDLLPSQYVRVEYLESDGLELIQVPTRFSTNNYMISGELSMSTKSQRQLWGNQSGQWYDMNDRDYGGVFSAAFTQIYRSTLKPSVDVRYKFEATATYAKLGDAVITGNLTSIPTYLGLFRIIGYPNFNFTGRVYSYEASEQGTLRVKLIPCIRKSDSKPGMFDIITSQFYTNSGDGEFTTGPILL